MDCESVKISIKKAFLDYDFFLAINITNNYFGGQKRIYLNCSSNKHNFYFIDTINNYLSCYNNPKKVIEYKIQEGVFSLLAKINSNLDELKKILLERKYGTKFYSIISEEIYNKLKKELTKSLNTN